MPWDNRLVCVNTTGDARATGRNDRFKCLSAHDIEPANIVNYKNFIHCIRLNTLVFDET